ncbi:recombinase RecT [Afipia sp. TerB]
MNTEVAIAQPSKADVFIGQVLPPDRMEAVLASLPDHVKPERFKRNLVVAVTQHPQLLDCDPLAVFNEVSKAAALGLYMDPQLGEAYLISGFSNGRRVPQLRLGYRGLIKLARQSGQIATVYAHEVCANDKFKMTLGTSKHIDHEPDLMGERGEIGLYYAVVKFADGNTSTPNS